MDTSISENLDMPIAIGNDVTSITNRTENSVLLVEQKKDGKTRLYKNIDINSIREKKLTKKVGKYFHFYHHGIVPHEITGYDNIIRIAPGLSYQTKNKDFVQVSGGNDDNFWSSDDKEAVQHYVKNITEQVTKSDADAILFSGGIDSLLLTVLDKEKRPLFHFNNDPIQRIVASELANELRRPLEIVEPEDFNTEDLELSLKLRNNGLGHYLPWNNGATFTKKTFGKKLISGQHADTLLMVDTFAPGINSHGIYWYARMLASCRKRAPYTMQSSVNVIKKVSALNNTINSFNEHVELGSLSNRNLSPIDNKTTRAFIREDISDHYQFIKYAKLLKKYRFCINANRIYKEVEQHTGYHRDLIYFSDNVQKDLINYIPNVIDCFNPKHLFYNIVKGHGIDYYKFKRNIIKRIIDAKYFLKRYYEKNKHHQSNVALEHIRWHANELGIDWSELLAEVNLTDSENYKKSELMILDRRLNYLQYVS